MAKTHYETLGVGRTAKPGEIRTAYRKLALKFHPDRSRDPAAPQLFRGIVEAYEVLNDAGARTRYDEFLTDSEAKVRLDREREKREDERRSHRLNHAAEDAAKTFEEVPLRSARIKTQFTVAEVAEMSRRLSILFGQQRFADSEALARQLIQIDPSRPLPYAILGDIARGRGAMEEAMKMYSFALQMDPTNATFLRRYEDILDRIHVEEGKGHRIRIEPQEKRVFAILAVSVVTLLACIYLILSPERPALSDLTWISTWTIGLIAMLFVSGACAGAAMSIGNLLDRVDAYSSGKMAPTVLYGLVSVVSFPLAVTAYAVIGFAQRAYSITSTRMMLAVVGITVCVGMASAVPSGFQSFLQVLLWGGNIVYLGALGGWMVADNLRA